MRKFICLFYILVCAFFENITLCFAAPLYFTFTPMGLTEPKTLCIDFDSAWFEEHSAYTYDHRIARIACLLADAAYGDIPVEENKENPVRDIENIYKTFGAKNISLRYDVDYNAELKNDQCAFSFAMLKLPSGKDLVITTIRGTPFGKEEWASNLNINDSGAEDAILHEGFRKAESQVISAFYEYLQLHNIDTKSSLFLVTGHSRGAAVANIIGAELAKTNKFDTNNLFVYTFASPNVTLEEDAENAKKYGFIWNIVNAEDAVPTVPLFYDNWKYRKYGTVKVLANAWNAGRDNFYNNIMQKVNGLHSYIMNEDYRPFGTGPFIPMQSTALFAWANSDPEKFYDGITSLHDPMEKTIDKYFSQKEKSKDSISDKIIEIYNDSHNGLIDDIMRSVYDMHACETYLSFMVALEDEECFYTDGCVQIILRGLPESVIMDKNGQTLIHITEGKTKITEQVKPLAANSLPFDKTSIGFPIDEDFDFIMTSTAVLPSPIRITVEYYDAQGRLIKRGEEQKLYPSQNEIIKFKAGKSLWKTEKISVKKIKGNAKRNLIKDTKIYSTFDHRLTWQVDLDTDLNLGVGIAYGTQLGFATLIFKSPLDNFLGKTWELDPGLGLKCKVWDRMYLLTEIFGKCVFIPDANVRQNGKSISFVPSARISAAFQPYRRVSIFAAASADIAIKGTNDAAFLVRNMNLKSIDITNNCSLVPSFSIGIRF